jgi:hypothetical protein
MALKMADGTFACTICGVKHAKEIDADRCKSSHELLYIPMTKTELNRLVNALFLGKPELVPESLFETLRRYQQASVR